MLLILTFLAAGLQELQEMGLAKWSSVTPFVLVTVFGVREG